MKGRTKMKKTISDLFYGNLNLFDRPMENNAEYNQSLRESAKARDELEATMTDEQKRLLNVYVDKCSLTSCHLEFSAFLIGFRVASRLLCEALVGKDNE